MATTRRGPNGKGIPAKQPSKAEEKKQAKPKPKAEPRQAQQIKEQDPLKNPLVQTLVADPKLKLAKPKSGAYVRILAGKQNLAYLVPNRKGVSVHGKGCKLRGSDKRGHVQVETEAQAAKVREQLEATAREATKA